MATNKPQIDYQKQGVRIPKDLHARIHESAAASGRSYNAELIARLEASFAPGGFGHAVIRLSAHGEGGAPAAPMPAEIAERLDRMENSLQHIVAGLQGGKLGKPSVKMGPAPGADSASKKKPA